MSSTLTAIVEQIFLKADPAEPIVPLNMQPVLAFLFLLAAFISTGLFVTNTKDNTVRAVTTSAVAAVGFSFGGVYLVNAVHVYTG